ncbi:hypothetical protein [Propionivibrio limicola]|uniref:hypothetical protein n=1 Tax=Propionivibrio limicola TaxID=167645 RepID=UPI0012928FAA|nr:hypothetical protein [Propionivibrio limicola]
MRHLRNLVYLLLGIVLSGFLMSNYAHAAIWTSADGLTALIRDSSGRVQTVRFPGVPSVTGTATGAIISGSIPTTISGGKIPVSVPYNVGRAVGKGVLARLAVGTLTGTVVGMAAEAGISALIDAAGYECDYSGCRYKEQPSSVVGQYIDAPAISVPKQFHSRTTDVWASFVDGPDAVSCKGPGQTLYNSSSPCPTGTVQEHLYRCSQCSPGFTKDVIELIPEHNECPTDYFYFGDGVCKKFVCPDGYLREGDTTTCTKQVATGPVSEEVVADAIAPGITPEQSQEIAQQAVNNNLPMETDSPVVNGPASVTSNPVSTTTSTTINNQTVNNTTTTTTTVYNVYNGDTVTTTAKDTTTTTQPDGTTVTTTEDVAETDVESSVSDTELPELPKLYEPKYPNGLTGVWNENIEAIKATPLFSLPQVFAPTGIDSGTCPVWRLSANLGPNMNYGTFDISPPCMIWPFLKAITIIGSLILARALIFGG